MNKLSIVVCVVITSTAFAAPPMPIMAPTIVPVMGASRVGVLPMPVVILPIIQNPDKIKNIDKLDNNKPENKCEGANKKC